MVKKMNDELNNSVKELVESVSVKFLKKGKKEYIIGTPKQIEEYTGISQAILSVLLRMAEQNGEAKVIEKVKSHTGRGKPSSVWEVSTAFKVQLGK